MNVILDNGVMRVEPEDGEHVWMPPQPAPEGARVVIGEGIWEGWPFAVVWHVLSGALVGDPYWFWSRDPDRVIAVSVIDSDGTITRYDETMLTVYGAPA